MKNVIQISGPLNLKGKVKIQGAKNSAMRLLIFPHISNGIYEFENIPDISSTRNIGYISELLGAKNIWHGDGKVTCDTTGVNQDSIFRAHITAEDFYHTSGGIYFGPLIASRWGDFLVEKSKTRVDTGGDALGNRDMSAVASTLSTCGIGLAFLENKLVFDLRSTEPIEIDARNSFGISTNALLAALFKRGKSTIENFVQNPEFMDCLEFLTKAGADIQKEDKILFINGPTNIKSINFRCMSDKNDFVTWIFAAIATRSEITFTNVNLKNIHIEPLMEVLDQWKVKLIQLDQNEVKIDLSKLNLTPVNIVAGNYPLFHSDWQPLIAPVLTQIPGESTIKDTLFTNRLEYWKQLGMMGAKFEYFSDPDLPIRDGNPRAVKVFGGTQLKGGQLLATDVRVGAGFTIAGLVANGKTELRGIEHIERGYEDFENRLKVLLN